MSRRRIPRRHRCNFDLLKAASHGDSERLRAALQEGADVNIDGDAAMFAAFSKKTALHWACQKAHWNVVRILLEHGAETETKDHYGETPLQSVKYEIQRGRVHSIPHDVRVLLGDTSKSSADEDRTYSGYIGRRLRSRMSEKKTRKENRRLARTNEGSENVDVLRRARDFHRGSLSTPPGVLPEPSIRVREASGFTAVGPGRRGLIEAPEEEVDMGGWTAKVYSKRQQEKLGVDEYGSYRDRKRNRMASMDTSLVHKVVETKRDQPRFQGNNLDTMSVGPIEYRRGGGEDDENDVSSCSMNTDSQRNHEDPIVETLRRSIIRNASLQDKPPFLANQILRLLTSQYVRHDMIQLVRSPELLRIAVADAMDVHSNCKESMRSVDELAASLTTTRRFLSPRRVGSLLENENIRLQYADHLPVPDHLEKDPQNVSVHVSRHGSIDVQHELSPMSPSNIQVRDLHELRQIEEKSPILVGCDDERVCVPSIGPDGSIKGYLYNYIAPNRPCVRFYWLQNGLLRCFKELGGFERTSVEMKGIHVRELSEPPFGIALQVGSSELKLQANDNQSFKVWIDALRRSAGSGVDKSHIIVNDSVENDDEDDDEDDDDNGDDDDGDDDDELPPPPPPPPDEDDDDELPPPPDDDDDVTNPPPSYSSDDEEEEMPDPPPMTASDDDSLPPPPEEEGSTIQADEEFPIPPKVRPRRGLSNSTYKIGAIVQVCNATLIRCVSQRRWNEIFEADSADAMRKCELWAGAFAEVEEVDTSDSSVKLKNFKRLNPKMSDVEPAGAWWPIETVRIKPE